MDRDFWIPKPLSFLRWSILVLQDNKDDIIIRCSVIWNFNQSRNECPYPLRCTLSTNLTSQLQITWRERKKLDEPAIKFNCIEIAIRQVIPTRIPIISTALTQLYLLQKSHCFNLKKI